MVLEKKKKKNHVFCVKYIVFYDLLTHKITTHNNMVWAAAS